MVVKSPIQCILKMTAMLFHFSYHAVFVYLTFSTCLSCIPVLLFFFKKCCWNIFWKTFSYNIIKSINMWTTNLNKVHCITNQVKHCLEYIVIVNFIVLQAFCTLKFPRYWPRLGQGGSRGCSPVCVVGWGVGLGRRRVVVSNLVAVERKNIDSL